MRIQHNIPAMNAYRNYNANTKALQGNLQKLSSGYKINKAGDDAAGLAISEKMRAQITGLEVAQKNAKDGISLVQTAEGALTEVHTMLNRMYSLAEQSANGTYADEVDREQLQKEVQSLRDEIDRIADSTNFNGKKLLDGSLGSAGGIDTGALETKKFDAVAGVFTSTGLANVTSLQNGDKIDVSFVLEDGKTGNQSTVKMQFEIGNSTAGTANQGLLLNGKAITDLNTAGTAAITELAQAIAAELKNNSKISDNFTVAATGTNTQIQFTAKNAGESAMKVVGFDISNTSGGGSATASQNLAMTVSTAPKDAFEAIDVTKLTAWDGKKSTLQDSIFEVNGEKFVVGVSALAGTGLTAEMKQLLSDAGVGNNFMAVTTASGTQVAAGTDATNLAAKIQTALGIKTDIGLESTTTAGVWVAATTGGLIALSGFANKSGSSSKGGLSLQIGDTSDEYNKMRVAVDDMHADAMGIGSIDIGTEDGASAAMTAIKDAINYVSNTRGTLGALQNRLDHTINNLSVQQENIQDAEATIRDVDVANEMMAYTKNNILVQSAQAMLAQANQLPQGVLQLLG